MTQLDEPCQANKDDVATGRCRYSIFIKTVAVAIHAVLQEAAEVVEKLAGNEPLRSSAASCKI